MANIRVLGDVELAGALSFSKNYSDFPLNPSPRTIVVKAGVPYIYTELVDGSGFFTWQPIGVKRASYLHTQGVASTVWTVSHNFNSNDFAYFVYDENHNLTIANITIVDDNTCQINLSAAMTGTVVLFSLQYLNSTTIAASQQIDLGGSALTTSAGVLKVSGNDVAFKSYVDAQDSALSTRIDNIAANIDPAAIDSISELLTAFQSSDGDLSTAISGLSSSTTAAVTAEQLRATSAESSLQSAIDSISNDLASSTSDLETEIADRIAADVTMQSNMDSAIASRVAADVTLQSNIDSETGSRVAADLVLQGNIDSETASRAAADLVLQGNIDLKADVATTYIKTEVDTSLATKVDKVTGKGLSTEDYSTAEKSKLAGIEDGAQVNVVTSVAGKTGSVTLIKSDVGLGNVDNTSDANKPVSVATQSALDLKANISSLATVATSGSYADLTGNPTKVSDFTNDSGFQTASDVATSIQEVVGAAPAALDTLVEIAAQLANDESAVSALTNVVSTKASTTYVDSAIATVTSGLTTSASDLATEIADRAAADLVLQGNIDSEATSRAAADLVLQGNIDLKADVATTYTKTEVDAAIAAAIEAFAATLYI